MNTTTHYFIALVFSVLASGCGLINIKTKGFGSGSSPSKAETSSNDGREPASPGGSHERANDDAFAKKMVAHLIGRAHAIESFEDDGYALPKGKGEFGFASKQEWINMENRLVYIAEQAHPNKEPKQIIQREACIQERMNAKAASPTRAKADTRCQVRPKRSWTVNHSGKDMFLRGVYVEHALEGRGKKLKRKLVNRFVQSLGNEWVPFRVPVSDNDYGVKSYVLKDVPMHTWPQATLRYALSFAKRHGASKKLIAKIKAAQASAPTHKCVTETWVVARDHEGGGRYGDVYWDQRTRAAAKFSTFGDIDCAKAKRQSNDGQLLRAIKNDHDNPNTILRVNYKKGSVWSVYYNKLDIPTLKRRNVQVYLRVET